MWAKSGVPGIFEAVRWMEERIGTSLDRVGAGDPEAIATMERKNMLKETMKVRTKTDFRRHTER
ncbi:MAG: hypothetical protein BLM47_12470 [Candidatus Reconcilbacillus cellulovorans]|jgi:hypothetical protein|uniref:Uncharacterized protein n=1 Tax=Candidatus Reconcilbacillus cellulovorans TaxID=1906605 RepID=A0A2A6DXY4_9BACL|nr:MAG: hypothetical protein BLM47_12470 [Candidatus Reconcilbacillus cellulovorans]